MQGRQDNSLRGWKETYYRSDLNHFSYCVKFPSLKAMKAHSKIPILAMLLLRQSRRGFPVLCREDLTTVVSKTIVSRLWDALETTEVGFLQERGG